MNDLERLNDKRIRRIFDTEIQDRIMGFFKAKKFSSIAILSLVYLGLTIFFYVYFLINSQVILLYFSQVFKIFDHTILALVAVTVFMVVCWLKPLIYIALYLAAVMNKQNALNKLLIFNSVFYQIIKVALYILVYAYILFLIFTIFFGLNIINAGLMGYIGFYVVFYVLSIVFLTVGFSYIGVNKRMVEISKSMSYNLEGFDDEFVKADGLKIGLYIHIFINIVFILLLFMEFRIIGFNIQKNPADVGTLNVMYNLILLVIVILINAIFISVNAIGHINHHTFFVDISEID